MIRHPGVLVANGRAATVRIERGAKLRPAWAQLGDGFWIERKSPIDLPGFVRNERGDLSFSLHDNEMLDNDDRVVHYRTPTDPGSSGSPVFNNQWNLIGLHHAGSREMRKLGGKDGTYEANEGIWIVPIVKAIREKPV